ncbi:zinc finger protein 425-like, partial [Hyalella azteca]|uniref:Zinc finger protein 425-like n=1 Tax=Hyalella azteca TaxID=294128 RepID=A0A8B7NS78_HYAAZ
MEAQVEAHDALPNSSQNTSALLGNQFGEGGSAPATGAADISGASSSKQHTRLGCYQRGLVAAGANHLQQLVDLEHPASGPHRCSKYTSSSGIGLQQHINAMHSTETTFQFPNCVQSHKRKFVQCSQCDYAGTTEGELKSHFLFSHTNEKSFQCYECDYACTRKKHLEIHFLHKHSTEKPVQCSECNYACTTKGALKSHFLHKHSTEKPIQCSE